MIHIIACRDCNIFYQQEPERDDIVRLEAPADGGQAAHPACAASPLRPHGRAPGTLSSCCSPHFLSVSVRPLLTAQQLVVIV